MSEKRKAQKAFLEQMGVEQTPLPRAIQAAKAPSADTAIIVCHGMGKQVPFETLNGVAGALILAEKENGTSPQPPKVALIPDKNDGYLPRAEVDVKGRAVHLYEVYWAPLTEGEVHSFDVLNFLTEAGWKGLWASFRGHFHRFLFGEWREIPIKPWTMPLLLLTLLVLVSLVFHYFCFGIIVLHRVLSSLGLPPLNSDVVTRCGQEWAWVLATTTVLLIFWAALAGLRMIVSTGTQWDNPSREKRFWLWIQLALTVLVVVVPMVLGDVAFLFKRPSAPFASGWLVEPVALGNAGNWTLLLLLFWGWLLWRVKEVIIQYVGDVAAYISAHKLNKFCKVREAIQQKALEIAEAVYAQQQYARILVVGHSLGSVVAYDMLNAIIRKDLMKGTSHVNASGRTIRLITFGSPLDKTAFLFRQHLKEKGLGVREALAAAVQPLISDATLWPQKWINIYSPADLISGKLEFYNPPGNARKVENISDYEANWPLLAHNQYWEDRQLRRVLYEAI